MPRHPRDYSNPQGVSKWQDLVFW